MRAQEDVSETVFLNAGFSKPDLGSGLEVIVDPIQDQAFENTALKLNKSGQPSLWHFQTLDTGPKI